MSNDRIIKFDLVTLDDLELMKGQQQIIMVLRHVRHTNHIDLPTDYSFTIAIWLDYAIPHFRDEMAKHR